MTHRTDSKLEKDSVEVCKAIQKYLAGMTLRELKASVPMYRDHLKQGLVSLKVFYI